MTTITLNQMPDVKRLVLAAFPSYRKLKVYVSVFPDSGMNINSYWDGGSRDEYAIVELGTMARRSLPTSTHPYFDVAARGLANQGNAVVETDRVGNLQLKVLPEGFALVRAGTFCGKAATAHIFVNAANMPQALTA